MVSSGKDGSSSTNVASSVTSVSPSILVHSNRSVYGVWEFFNIQVPTFSLASVFSMLIVVTFLILALALMHKHVVKPSWKPSSQQLSEKFRLYMAGSMVGARRMFNGWTMSRQDDVTISNRDEKNRRLSLDMSSSSSISLSPSDPVDDTAPRLHKKASNTRLSSHRRSNLRSKPQILSPIDDNPSTISSNDDQPIDQSTETDESKTTVTINVSDPRSEHVTHQEIDYEIGRVSVNQLHQNFENGSQSNNDNQEIINSRNESFQNSVTNNDNETNSHIPFDTSLNTSLDTSLKTSLVPSLIPTTNDISTQLHKKNSKPKLKVQQRSQKDQKDQTVFFTTQESEGEVESSSSIPSTPKNVQDSTQEENFVKPGNRRRRRKPKNSKNNSQQNFQQQNSQQENNNHSEQRSSLQKHDHIQQNINGLSRSRQSDEI
ncbi:31749_t:CDS:2 [Gigaspora margarita]|uniref:31749_t:CDS:1 n=1 Tax=Gigaspora margarita TaxID=4874 RepID=A0ABN7UHD6_GIGMA|nr:31749_t:CDS:2 [Gigaspora margarita]